MNVIYNLNAGVKFNASMIKHNVLFTKILIIRFKNKN